MTKEAQQKKEAVCNGIRAAFPPTGLGLTKREYFAGQILAGLFSNPQMTGTDNYLATCSVAAADALLLALEKQ